MPITVTESIFGTAKNPMTERNETIRCFTLTNVIVSVDVITLGATITSIRMPDRDEDIDDIVMGFDNPEDYQRYDAYFGATIGRVANRIRRGKFVLNNQEVQLTRNANFRDHLHGGHIGFDKVIWTVVQVTSDSVKMEHRSPDRHEGYPGEVIAHVQFKVDEYTLRITMEGETDKTTVINMTNHTYFNLAGHGSAKHGLLAHWIKINAKTITERDLDVDLDPLGNLYGVADTIYDFRSGALLGDRFAEVENYDGYDENFVIDCRATRTLNNEVIVATVFHAGTGRRMTITSNQPGVQFYTSNYLPNVDANERPINGKKNTPYVRHGAFCLETQKFPDSPNHVNFPSIELRPGEKYKHYVAYKFSIEPYCYCEAEWLLGILMTAVLWSFAFIVVYFTVPFAQNIMDTCFDWIASLF